MGCLCSKQTKGTTKVVGSAELNATTDAASPETNIATASNVQVSLPIRTDSRLSETSGRERAEATPLAARRSTRRSTNKARSNTAAGGFNPPETLEPPIPLSSARSGRGSGATPPDVSPESHHPSSAPTDPGQKSPLKIDGLQDLSSASGRLSEGANARDRTGQLTERTEPMFTGGLSNGSQAKLVNRAAETKISTTSDVQVSLPTGTDITQFESSRRAAGGGEAIPPAMAAPLTRRPSHNPKPQTVFNRYKPPETPEPPIPLVSARSRRGSGATPPDVSPESHYPSSAPTDPGQKSPLKLDGLQNVSSASGKLSEGANARDRTGQLTERTEPMFTGGLSNGSQAKLVNRAAETKISTTSDVQVSLPTGTDITQFESSGRAAGGGEAIPPATATPPEHRPSHNPKPKNVANRYNPPETPKPPFPLLSARSRRGSGAAQPDEAPESHHPSSAPTDPDQKSPLKIYGLQDLSSASGKLSEGANARDRTGQLTERTEPMFTGGLSNGSQAKLVNRVVETKTSPASDVQVSLPTGTDSTQFESSRRAAGGGEAIPPAMAAPPEHRPSHNPKPKNVANRYKPPETPEPPIPLPSARSRRGSGATPPAEVPESHRPSSASTDSAKRSPLNIDELQDLSSANGELSEKVKAWDLTGQLTERTKPIYTGGFSDVSKAKLGDRVVAVKTLRLTNIKSGDENRVVKRLAREIYVWAALDHPNILEFLGFAIEDERSCLISPWCDNGTLHEYLPKFPDTDRRHLVREIAEGLRYLHEQSPPIIHGDLKPTNIFVTGDHVAKISDFGSARPFGQLRTGLTTSGSVPTTIRYNAPEILRDGGNPTLCSDVFSFAYIALETVTGNKPFWRMSNDAGMVHVVVIEKQTPSPQDHPGMEDATWEVLRRCWKYEPSDRPRMVDVCQMLSATEYGSSTGFYPPPRAGASYPPPRGSTV